MTFLSKELSFSNSMAKDKQPTMAMAGAPLTLKINSYSTLLFFLHIFLFNTENENKQAQNLNYSN